ncbi:Hint domain-containing protein [Ruegeria sp. R14_0]|uniref:Hint domain-containing protein n=1 Tax=Ruegeria sp. R14_0 TaxID=2821100 RepID=UPI001ADC60EE|nr:Hint domain-containing protein [Ruegeria sp. R14_0]MBO9447793.1 Hint domain-containing protein [Ruegeria sp. R14_0]
MIADFVPDTADANDIVVGGSIINNSDTPDGTIFTYTGGTGTTITLDDTAGSPDVFDDDLPTGHIITDGGGIVANGTQVESESIITVQALDDDLNPTGPEITIYVFSQNGVTQDVWGFATSAPLDSGTSYIKTGGSNAGSSPYTDYVTCFGPGTLIETADGAVAVQDLKKGQLVWTRDGGFQPILWIATTEVHGNGPFAPVVIEAGAIGNTQELVVSQQHRILIGSPATDMLFGSSEVFVAAKHLCGLPGVSIRQTDRITYTHFMFDRHHIVRSNGALTESYYFGDNAKYALSSPQRSEILALFPSIEDASNAFQRTAAPTISAREAGVLRAYM